MKKKFIITIDTEGDNQWSWSEGAVVNTENVDYLMRFQLLCERFGFKPVWLTNYEMISDSKYIDFICDVERRGTGELGMHLHAWTTPPAYSLVKEYNNAPYLIEYPSEVMEEKIVFLTDEIVNRTGIRPTSHRAGRWAMNNEYFRLLKKHGYSVDCSVTPGIDWTNYKGQSINSKGSNYSAEIAHPHYVDGDSSLLEVPMTIQYSKKLFVPEHISVREIAGSVYKSIKGHNIWLRPNGKNLKQMLFLINEYYKSDDDYVMFMLHSSELMPGGSPTFTSRESIEKLYQDLQYLFEEIENKFEGITLRDYAKTFKGN